MWRTYQVYQPKVDHFLVTSRQSHDSTIAWFRDRWIVQFDSGTEQPGQRIFQCTSRDLKTWSEPIEVYTSPAGSVDPVPVAEEAKQWQPGFVSVGDELWSFWVQTAGDDLSGTGQAGLFFSKLTDPDGRWTHRRIFGPGMEGEHGWRRDDGVSETMFVGNGGIVTHGSGVRRVLVPVTLRHKTPGQQGESQYDLVIYSDDGGDTWHRSQPVRSPGEQQRAWEATIWQPEKGEGGEGSEGGEGEVWMISRNGFTSRPMDKSQHYAVSRDLGATWSDPKRPLPMELALSRSFVTTFGPRNILVQHDRWHPSEHHWHHRTSLALMFNRGPGVGFVQGLLLTDVGPYADYPQMAIRGEVGAVVYTRQDPKKKWNVDARSQWVARIDPLPDPDHYYLFPRTAHGHIRTAEEEGRTLLRFDADLGSAGIDLDANDPATDTLHLAFRFRVDEASKEPLTLFTLGHPAAKLVADGGRVELVTDDATADAGDVGEGWTGVELISGGGELRARLEGGEWVAVTHSPTYRWPYLGRGYFREAPDDVDGGFSIDVGSVRSRVITP